MRRYVQVHVYYDIQTSSDLVVLEYKDCRNPKRPPLVRIHSESIFSRFPLRASSYKRKYHNSIESIIKHGVGMVVLMYHDGRYRNSLSLSFFNCIAAKS